MTDKTICFKINLMIGSSLAPKWPILAPFCGMDHQNSILYWYMIPFLYFLLLRPASVSFLNILKKLKFPNLLKPQGTLIWKKILILLSLSHLDSTSSIWYTLYTAAISESLEIPRRIPPWKIISDKGWLNNSLWCRAFCAFEWLAQ